MRACMHACTPYIRMLPSPRLVVQVAAVRLGPFRLTFHSKLDML